MPTDAAWRAALSKPHNAEATPLLPRSVARVRRAAYEGSKEDFRLPRGVIRKQVQQHLRAQRNSPAYLEAQRLDAAAEAVRACTERSYRQQPQAVGLRKRGRHDTQDT